MCTRKLAPAFVRAEYVLLTGHKLVKLKISISDFHLLRKTF